MASDPQRERAPATPVPASGSEVKRLQALADAAFEGLAIHKQGTILYVNEALARMMGTSAREAVGRPVFAFAAPESHEQIAANVQNNVESPYEGMALRADGTTFPVELQAKSIVIDGEVVRAVAIRDLSERRRMENALAQSQADYQSLFEKAADGIGIARVDGTIESYNASVAALLGYDRNELVGKSFASLVSRTNQAEKPIRWQDLRQGIAVRGERTLVRKDGSTVQVDLNSSPLGDGRILTVFRDVTERNQLREQLLQSQKLESVGRLAGGIAHDFNNLLTVVLSNADMIRNRLASDDSPLAAWAADIARAAERAAELTAQLLTFSRRQVVQREALELNDVVREAERLFRRIIGEDIEVFLDLEHTLPAILANRAQVMQIIMNLLINSRDAMPGGGRVVLQTRRMAGALAGARDATAQVLFVVSDTGSGMSQETLSRAFEPFFTTKPIGEGTGLGLATVYGIVKQSEGQIEIESEQGSGTTLRMAFPAIEAQPSLPATEQRVVGSRVQDTVIVLVEDESAVAEVARRILQGHGYTVHVASSPAEAMRVIPQVERFDLLITDVVMPEMNGYELAQKVTRDYPALKVLYASGYTEDTLLQKGITSQALHFLSKPFTARTLLDKVQDVLHQ